MKNLIIVLSAFFAFSAVASAQTATKKEEQTVVYMCPTHSCCTNSNSDKCPKCGMELIKITEKIPTYALKGSQPMTKTVTRYVCPMDSTTPDKPGKCSKCAIAIVKTTEKVNTYALKGSQPMTKTVTKYSTEGKCSKCGMDLVKINEKIDTHPLKGSQPKSKIVSRYVCPMDGTTAGITGEYPN